RPGRRRGTGRWEPCRTPRRPWSPPRPGGGPAARPSPAVPCGTDLAAAPEHRDPGVYGNARTPGRDRGEQDHRWGRSGDPGERREPRMIRLDRLVNVLGRFGVRLYCEPGAREAELRSVVTYDPTDPRPVGGDVFLAVGVATAAEAVALAEAANAVVVLVRTTVPLDADVLDRARRAGVAVAALDPAVSWSQLAAVAYGLVLEGRETEAG